VKPYPKDRLSDCCEYQAGETRHSDWAIVVIVALGVAGLLLLLVFPVRQL